MQSVMIENVRIISNNKMRHDIGISARQLDNTIHSECFLPYILVSINYFRYNLKNLEEEYSKDFPIDEYYIQMKDIYERMINYLIALGCKERDKVFICVD